MMGRNEKEKKICIAHQMEDKPLLEEKEKRSKERDMRDEARYAICLSAKATNPCRRQGSETVNPLTKRQNGSDQ